MSTLQALIAWSKVFAVWAAIAVFFGAVAGVGIVASRAVVALLGGK
jgi:hypothetical protein